MGKANVAKCKTLRAPNFKPNAAFKPHAKCFPFQKLPAELRLKIYHLLLINKNAITIMLGDLEPWEDVSSSESDEPAGEIEKIVSESQAYEDSQRLTVSNKLGREVNDWTISTSILGVSKSIHYEAAPILYGSNKFRFFGDDNWGDLLLFGKRLTETSRRNFRTIDTASPTLEPEFPTFKRGSIRGAIRQAVDLDLPVLWAFPYLEKVKFAVWDDLITRDISVLQMMRDLFPRERGCGVVLEFEKWPECGCGNCRICIEEEREIKVSSGILAAMTKWGWEWRGDVESVDQSHPFSDRKKWREMLVEED